MSEPKVALEVAEVEFQRWAEGMDLDRKLDPSRLTDSDDKKSLVETKGVILDAIEQGHLVVDDQGQFVFTPQKIDTSKIIFFEPTGASLMSMDSKGDGNPVAKTMTILANITKQSVPRFAKMVNRDLSVCQAILTLFLAK